MKCQHHTGQIKTHICLKSLCKHSVVCPICIAQDHQNHLTIELLQFKRGVANMIAQHDNPDPLPNIHETAHSILKVEQQLQEQIKKLYQLKKDTIEIHQFKLVESILREEQPTITQLMALKRVGQQMVFYKDEQNQWQFSIVADNQEYKNYDKQIQHLRNQVKEQTTRLSNVLMSLQSISNIIATELQKGPGEYETVERPVYYKNVKSEIQIDGTCDEYQPSAKQEQQQSLELLRMLENNSDGEGEDSQSKEKNTNTVPQKKITPILPLFPERKYISVQPAPQGEHLVQIREKRKYVKKADKQTLNATKRIYRRKTYNRFKFNSDQCIGIFRGLLD